jgi:hypothetical protein
MAKRPAKTQLVARHARTGAFVTLAYAKRYPHLTIVHRFKRTK